MVCASATYAVMRCLSVTFVYSVEMNKRIFNIFHLRVATPFFTKRYGKYSDGTPNWGKIATFD